MSTHFPCPPAAIIFDMDGLLVDSERLWKVAETDLLAQHGATYSDEKHAPFIGMGLDEFLPSIKRVYELEVSVEALQTELMAQMLQLVKTDANPQPGAAELIQFVDKHSIPRAIASSSPLDLIHATVGSQDGWDDIFLTRASAGEVQRGKPAPDVYLLAAERLGVPPEQCLALEDSPNGARAAVAAGMTCFAVPDAAHTDPARFDGVTPFVFNSLHEVLERLNGCI